MPIVLPAPADWRLKCDDELVPLVCLLVYPEGDASFDVLAIDGSRMRGDYTLVTGCGVSVDLHGDLV
jgi:hypothetical protein